MMRQRHLRKPELLAPAGTLEALKEVILAGADAVYCGGKNFNMRLHRNDFNLTDDELEEAVKWCHERGKKLYVTVNSLLGDDELRWVGTYLKFLESIGVDAIILQDMGVLHLANELGLRIYKHASTMMNAHSSYAAMALAELGIRRIITSRDITLAQVKSLWQETGLEFEYFVHGDMCIAQSGQCFTSGILFGESSNRGRCLKPCRWPYDLIDAKTGQSKANGQGGPYLLARKDMCMIQHIPDMVDAGICSFKIEGRMRPAELLKVIVESYRAALDEYWSAPYSYRTAKSRYQELYGARIREFSSNYAFGNPGATSIGFSGKREPRFFSSPPEITFETPQAAIRVELSEKEGTALRSRNQTRCHCEEQRVIDPSDEAISASHRDCFASLAMTVCQKSRQKFMISTVSSIESLPEYDSIPFLAVRAGSPEAAYGAANAGADLIYIGGEVFSDEGTHWSQDSIKKFISFAQTSGKQVGIASPRITTARELWEMECLLRCLEDEPIDSVLVTNIGSLRLSTQYRPGCSVADFTLNVLNTGSIRLLKQLNVKRFTPAAEASLKTALSLSRSGVLPAEVVVHGPALGAVMEHCIFAANIHCIPSSGDCPMQCREGKYALQDERGQAYLIMVDQYCRNHLLLPFDICLLPLVGELFEANVRALRVEGQYYDAGYLAALTGLYRRKIDRIAAGEDNPDSDERDYQNLVELSPRRFSIRNYPKGVLSSPSHPCEEESPCIRTC